MASYLWQKETLKEGQKLLLTMVSITMNNISFEQIMFYTKYTISCVHIDLHISKHKYNTLYMSLTQNFNDSTSYQYFFKPYFYFIIEPELIKPKALTQSWLKT